jgi:hypothetical protein
MTPDDLETLILDPKDHWLLQKALAPLSEKDRAKLSPHAHKLHTQLSRNKLAESASDRLKAFFATCRQGAGQGWNFWSSDANRCATLALFGLCPASVLKKSGIIIYHQDYEILERIVEERHPGWLDDWLAHTLNEQVPRVRFDTLRRWIKNGLCKKPEADGYYQLFASHLMRLPRHNSGEIVPLISQQLLADPDMLKDVGALFRIESIAFNTNSWLTNGAPPNYETWPDALVKLSAEGHLDRGHLLTTILEGLRLDLKQNQLSGFHGLYRRLAPSRDERLQHQADYIALLCHPVGHVAKFALDMLNEIEKDGMLDTGAVLGELPLVLVGESKGNASAALKLIGRILTREDEFETLALATTSEALRHAAPDVQRQALSLLEKSASRLSDAQLETLDGLEAFVAASNRQRLSALLSVRQSNTGSTVAAAHAAIIDTPRYSVTSADINDQNVLFAEDRLTPISSVDELIDALFHAVEVVESPDEVERIIDAIGRFAGDKPADFADRIAPLLHRQRTQMQSNKGLVVVPFGIGGAVLDLLGTWITGQLVNTARKPESHETAHEGFVPLRAHLGELAQRVALGRPCMVLSAPTHKGGWIDPLVWVQRLHEVSSEDVIGSMDFRLSLLRLAPDSRRQALAALDDLPDGLRRVAAFALGGSEMPNKADRSGYATWISAARCRAPHKDWRAEFAALNLADPWMDSLAPAQYSWQSTHRKQTFQNQTFRFPQLDISTGDTSAVQPEKPGGFLAGIAQAVSNPLSTSWEAIPSAALVRGIEQERHWYTQYELYAVWLTRWLAYIWPQNPSAVYMKAVKGLATNIDEAGSTWGPRFGFFYALFQKNRPWRESGHLLLCLGLAARDADVKGLAVDALIEGIDSRLFDPDLFVATVSRVAEGEWLKLNRMGQSLATVIQISPLHAAVVGEVVQKWLPVFDHHQTNAFAILEVLLEVQALTAVPLSPDARASLDTIKGSGKTAKTAQLLLKRDGATAG